MKQFGDMKSIFTHRTPQAILVLLVTTVLFVALPTTASARYGLKDTAEKAGLVTEGNVPEIIGRLVGSALTLVGLIFFILVVYAGIRWMLARGNEEETKGALRTIVAATIGLIITFSAYAITNFVLTSINESEITQNQDGQ